MAQYEHGLNQSTKWYKKQIFPLVPIIETRESGEHNTYNFTFRWLFVTIWTLDGFAFEFSVVMDTHWGIGFVGIFPYLRWVIAIPCPAKLEMWMHKKLWRKPKSLKQPKP